MQIIQDEKFLRQKSENATLENAKFIASQLFDTLNKRGEGDVGLSAPQIGIQKRVCVVRAKTPIVLVNPEVIETNGTTWYQEGCLSFPNASIRTKRHASIVVKCEWVGVNDIDTEWQENMTLYFTPDGNPHMEDDVSLLESVAVQHELDHLDGILMFDREWKNETITNDKKYKPNEKVKIEDNDGNVLEIKYKKAQSYLSSGWKIIN